MKKGILTVIIIAFVLFSLAPSLYELSRVGSLQSNRAFELVHNFPTDYNFYLSRIRMGLEGKWTVREVYTTEIHNGSFIHEFYLLLGKVGAWVRVPHNRPADVYHVARVVLAFALLFAIAAWCKRSFESKVSATTWIVISFLLVITASSWPKLTFVAGAPRFGGYMAWWSVMDSLQRITFIPHLLAGQALMLGIVLVFATKIDTKRKGLHMFLGILGFILGMVFPPGLIFVYTTLVVIILLDWLFAKKQLKQVAREWFVPIFSFVCVSAPALIYLFLMTSFYPWKRLAELDIIHPLPFDYMEYVKALGPMLPLGLIGAAIAIFRRERHLFPAVAWVFAWMVLLFIFRFVPSQSPLRFSEMVPHVGLGILATYLFFSMFTFVKLRALREISQFAALFISLGLILSGLFHMYSSYMWQKDFVDHKIRASVPLVPTGSYVMYPLRDFIAAISYVQENADRETIVLSETTAGNYIPVYSGNRVFVGHDNTVNAEQKRVDVARFFSGEMKLNEAREFVRSTGASYVFFGPQEREDGAVADLSRIYPFLLSVYQNTYVTIYSIL